MEKSLSKKKLIDSTELNRIIESFSALNYVLDGEEETLVDTATRKEKYKFLPFKEEEFAKLFKMVCKYINAKMILCYNMIKVKIPSNYQEKTNELNSKRKISIPNSKPLVYPHSSIYTSKDFGSNKKLLIIIPDRGENNLPGIFSIVSIFYESLFKGSMFDYIYGAQNNGYSVLVLNPNKLKSGKTQQNIEEFNDHYSHCEYIFNEYLINSNKSINNIVFLAHHNAGISLIKLMNKYSKFIKVN
jgi:hypothetical protein